MRAYQGQHRAARSAPAFGTALFKCLTLSVCALIFLAHEGRAQAVRVPAEPRSLQLVAVPLPERFANDDSVSFRVVRARGAQVSGPTEGVLAGAAQRVLLSVSVPSQAHAGVHPSAEVHFRSLRDEDAAVVVPVELLVARTRAVSLTSGTAVVHVEQGRQATVTYTIANSGNSPDTLQLALAVPDGWRAAVRNLAPLVLQPGERVTRELTLTAPRDERPGTAMLELTAVRMDAPAAAAAHSATQTPAIVSGSTPLALDVSQRTLRIPLEALPATRTAAAFGPVLGVSYSAVQTAGLDAQGSVGLTLNGPLARGVSMSASWTQRALFGTPGVSRVGGGQLFPTLLLQHNRWQLSAGNAATDLGDVAGLLRAGRGLSFNYADSAWQVTAIAARPFTFDVPATSQLLPGLEGRTRSDGVLAGVRARVVRGDMAWSSTVSQLRDPLMLNASLSALTVGAERLLGSAATARGELALRRWDEGQGLGAAAELGQRNRDSDWRLHATYAPGARLAFARAQTYVTLTGTRRLGGTRLGYVGFYAADEGGAAATQATGGFGLMPQWTLGTGGSVGLEARVNRSRSGTGDARFATTSQAFGGFGASRLGPLTATTSATWQRTSRAIALSGSDAVRLDEGQFTWSTQLLLPFAFGTIDAWSSLQRQFGINALADGQYDLMVRAEGVAVPFTRGRLTAGAAVGRMLSLGTGVQLFTQRVGLSAVLPFDTYVRLDTERNPLIRGSNGSGNRGGWSTALRVERSFGTPSFLRGGRGTGVVFEDRNGNGVRDGNERGLPGVLLRVGGEVVVTDRGGVYRLTRPGGGVPTVDERSLPFGLMVAPQATRAAMAGVRDGAFDVPVVPVGAVDVQLDLATDGVQLGGPLSLQGVRVYATDATGRRHLALLLPNGVARFEALPPGEYTLGVDGSAAAEPLTLQGVAPRFRIDGAAAQQLRAVVGPRRVRMFRAPPAHRTRSSSSEGKAEQSGGAAAAGTGA